MLIMVRHGQTAVNAQGLLQGHLNPDLDEVGRMQALRLGAHVREHHRGARIVSSPLARAVQTASAISDEFTIDERFIELDYGSWDGLSMGEIDRSTWQSWRSDPGFRPPGGESLRELDERVVPALEELFMEAKDHTIVVVTHVSPIKSAITWALGVGPDATWRCHLDRASITRIAVTERGPVLAAMNETGHL